MGGLNALQMLTTYFRYRGDGTNSFPIDIFTNTSAKNYFLSTFLQLSTIAHACTLTQYLKIEYNTLCGTLETRYITNKPTICRVALSYENLQNSACA